MLTGACLAVAMAGIDTTVVVVALAKIQRDLTISFDGLQWVLNAYLLTSGALVLVGGRLGDLFGRRRVFVLGISVFAIASALCGVAPTGWWLIANRALQGVGLAFMLPGAVALVTAAFPDERQRGRAIGIWTAVLGASMAAGPLIGGVLTDHVSWRAVFLVNIPVAAASLAIVLRAGRESRDRSAERVVDVTGLILITLSLTCLLLGIVQSGTWGWGSPSVIALLVGAAVLMIAFIYSQARTRFPLIHLGVFRERTVVGASLGSLFTFFSMFCWLFFFALYLQYVLGESPQSTGILQLPGTVALAVTAIPASRVAERLGPRVPAVAGCTLSAVGLALLAPIAGNWGYSRLWLPFVLVGAGIGLALTPLSSATVRALPGGQAGSAGGLIYMVRWIGGALGVAVGSAVFQTLATGRVNELAHSNPIVGRQLASFQGLLSNHALRSDDLSHLPGAVRAALDSVFAHGVGGVMVLATAVAAAAAVAGLLIRRVQPTAPSLPMPPASPVTTGGTTTANDGLRHGPGPVPRSRKPSALPPSTPG